MVSSLRYGGPSSWALCGPPGSDGRRLAALDFPAPSQHRRHKNQVHLRLRDHRYGVTAGQAEAEQTTPEAASVCRNLSWSVRHGGPGPGPLPGGCSDGDGTPLLVPRRLVAARCRKPNPTQVTSSRWCVAACASTGCRGRSCWAGLPSDWASEPESVVHRTMASWSASTGLAAWSRRFVGSVRAPGSAPRCAPFEVRAAAAADLVRRRNTNLDAYGSSLLVSAQPVQTMSPTPNSTGSPTIAAAATERSSHARHPNPTPNHPTPTPTHRSLAARTAYAPRHPRAFALGLRRRRASAAAAGRRSSSSRGA
jgi:hypothetical protein